MGRLLSCNKCGHRQLIGHNDVDGRIKWWTKCDECGKGNFLTPVDPKITRLLSKAGKK